MNTTPKYRHYMRLSAFTLGIASLALSSAAGASCNMESYTGSVCLTAASYCPRGTLEADGQILPIKENMTLYSLLGNTYGGDGVRTFRLPDLRGRTPVGVGQAPGLTNITLGEQRGAESVYQTVDQMPPHTHQALFTPNPSEPVKVEVAAQDATAHKVTDKNMLAEPNTGLQPGDDVNLFSGPGNTTIPLAGVSGGTNTGGTVRVSSTGSGQSINVVSPQLGLRYCIVTGGIYPVRPD
ncbi:phage tail protein [Kordiimonas lipolytica]|uniref:Phage tail protein n=1 Tax=Kordiimonas lipolytica TaxID=1662421 RepID=A0ABV8UDN6_9PROT|nr:tail fiber protein [Kordiimonas lipolytica]